MGVCESAGILGSEIGFWKIAEDCHLAGVKIRVAGNHQRLQIAEVDDYSFEKGRLQFWANSEISAKSKQLLNCLVL